MNEYFDEGGSPKTGNSACVQRALFLARRAALSFRPLLLGSRSPTLKCRRSVVVATASRLPRLISSLSSSLRLFVSPFFPPFLSPSLPFSFSPFLPPFTTRTAQRAPHLCCSRTPHGRRPRRPTRTGPGGDSSRARQGRRRPPRRQRRRRWRCRGPWQDRPRWRGGRKRG